MPIPKYRCRECGKEFAKIFINPENAPKQCPVCFAIEPEYLGPAFESDLSQLQRLSCASCDSCGEGMPIRGCAVS
jgi:putative FmdB family regulatory protein